MLRYELFLLADGVIRARQAFLADDDEEALVDAVVLWDACSDVCSGYELWNGSRMLVQARNPYPAGVDALTGHRQRQIVDLEETLHNSHGNLVRSARLLELIGKAHTRDG